jgi:hypothetical protein
MADIAGFPFFEMQFTKSGDVFSGDELQKVLSFVSGDVTDLFVISHGWNNDMADARQLYQGFFKRMRQEVDAARVPGIAGRKFGILGVLWPSKKFTDQDLIPSGAASLGGPVTTQALAKEIDRVKDAFDKPTAAADLEKAKALMAKLDDSPAARDELVSLLRSLLPEQTAGDEERPAALNSLPGRDLLQRLSVPVLPAASAAHAGGGAAALSSAGGAAGSAASFGLLSGIKGAAFKLLNLITYYQMKERAGTVGRSGLNSVLRQIRARHPNLRLHLIGHSFGGRLVSAAALGPDGQPPMKLTTLSLLQAAFSHYGFAQNYDPGKDGFFRKVVTESRIAGPVVITCTLNDKAVGTAYPLASQIAGQVAAAFGDKNNRFGGLGANGAQKTPEAVDGKLLPAGGSYQFASSKLYNLNADAIIKDHSDIVKNEVAHAILAAVAAAP